MDVPDRVLAPSPQAVSLRSSSGRWLRVTAVSLLLLYAAALRFEALVARYDVGRESAAVRRVQRAIRALHPGTLNWERVEEPYAGDPFGYLERARSMEFFYEPSVREPVFVLLTKIGLLFSNDADYGVSLASGASSVLLVLATYLLGAVAFSPAVGLLAATGMAIERYVIELSVEGWRDDTFAFLLVLWTALLLRFRDRMTRRRALALGIVGGLACLTRITALSFLLPGYALALLFGGGAPLRIRMARVGESLLVAGALLAPFLVNCAIETGDPFYAINYHTGFYLAREQAPVTAPMSWVDYLRYRFRPFGFAETFLVGVSAYPFSNKWTGFDVWASGLGAFLSWAAAAGILILLWSSRGRLLLAVLIASLLPYAFTYEIAGGREWRFTLHAYPFYLVAAALVLTTIGALLHPRAARSALRSLLARRSLVLSRLSVTALVLGAVWLLGAGLHYLRVAESIRHGETVRVHAGAFDAFFFGDGWGWPKRRGNVVARASNEDEAVLWLPLVGHRDYHLDLRIDPHPVRSGPPPRVRVEVNGRRLSDFQLTIHPRRMGSYAVVLPSSLLVEGSNRIDIDAEPSAVGGSLDEEDPDPGVLLWFVRIRPAGKRPQASATPPVRRAARAPSIPAPTSPTRDVRSSPG